MINFTNSFVKRLKASAIDHSMIRVSQETKFCHYALAEPFSASRPQEVFYSQNLAKLIGLPLSADILSGKTLLPGMRPITTRYGGHQFGHWAGQLGDGRAMLLGEIETLTGERFELQLKGAGITVYSRRGDGKAVLRSSVREHLCSEYMFYLGVPTTRSLSCLRSGELVVRDMFYDGNPQQEPGAIVLRVAPSFIRFGHFEILAANNEMDELRQLFDFVHQNYFSYLNEESFFKQNSEEAASEWLHRFSRYEGQDVTLWSGLSLELKNIFLKNTSEDLVGVSSSQDRLIALLFADVCARTAYLIAHWMRTGFTHGVMNTDNMSILGLTIDYGPFGFLDDFDPSWTPNTTDAQQRRYRYGQQPAVAQWNLARLAEALSMMMSQPDLLNMGLQTYADGFAQCFKYMTAMKLGLETSQIEKNNLQILEAVNIFLTSEEIDYTLFYKALEQWRGQSVKDNTVFSSCFYKSEISREEASARQGRLQNFLQVYGEEVAALKESMSSKTALAKITEANPQFLLRNYILQMVIDELQGNDPAHESSQALVQEVLQVMEQPYALTDLSLKWSSRRPDWARNKAGCSALSCSS